MPHGVQLTELGIAEYEPTMQDKHVLELIWKDPAVQMIHAEAATEDTCPMAHCEQAEVFTAKKVPGEHGVHVVY